MQLYTDPKRVRLTDPGQIEGNPLWIFHDAFNPDKYWVEEAKAQYRGGKIGDVVCKKKLIDVLNDLLELNSGNISSFHSNPKRIIAVYFIYIVHFSYLDFCLILILLY